MRAIYLVAHQECAAYERALGGLGFDQQELLERDLRRVKTLLETTLPRRRRALLRDPLARGRRGRRATAPPRRSTDRRLRGAASAAAAGSRAPACRRPPRRLRDSHAARAMVRQPAAREPHCGRRPDTPRGFGSSAQEASMAVVAFRGVTQGLRRRHARRLGHGPRDRRRRVRRAGRAFGLRQDDGAAHARRARDHHLGHDHHRRHGRQRRGAARPRHRHGVPELRALPAPEGVRQHRLRAAAAQGRPRTRSTSACGTRPRCSASRTSSTASRAPSPAASASGSPWGAPSCASPRRSSWTSRSPTSTPSCACRCAPRSAACRTSSA